MSLIPEATGKRRMSKHLRQAADTEGQTDFPSVGGEKASTPRESMRAGVREETPADRARRRAAEIRGTFDPYDDGVDEFAIPKELIPEGWTYEWKRHKLINQEDPSYQVELRRRGWDPVPASRHPEMMPTSYKGDTIERKGLILMEKPTEVVEEVRHAEYIRAKRQVRDKEAQIAGAPEGTLTRDHALTRPKITKSFESLPIPEK